METETNSSTSETAAPHDAISTTRTLMECIAYYASPDSWGVDSIYITTLTEILGTYGVDLDSEPTP